MSFGKSVDLSPESAFSSTFLIGFLAGFVGLPCLPYDFPLTGELFLPFPPLGAPLGY